MNHRQNVTIPVEARQNPLTPYSEVKFFSPTLRGFLCTTKDIS
jgi:hypothetical protein